MINVTWQGECDQCDSKGTVINVTKQGDFDQCDIARGM